MNYKINTDFTVRFNLNEVDELVSVALRNLCGSDIEQESIRKNAMLVLHSILVEGTSFGLRTYIYLCENAKKLGNPISENAVPSKDFVSPYQRATKDGHYYKALFPVDGHKSASASAGRLKVLDRAAKAVVASLKEHDLALDIALNRMQFAGFDDRKSLMLRQLLLVLTAITGAVYAHPVLVPTDRNTQRRYKREAVSCQKATQKVAQIQPKLENELLLEPDEVDLSEVYLDRSAG